MNTCTTTELTPGQIIHTLQAHGIEYRTEGRLVFGQLVYTQDGETRTEWVDLTDYSWWQLCRWVGYC